MRILVDTHLLLWAAARSRRLPKEARRLLEDPRSEVHYSADVLSGYGETVRVVL